ncbi:MAG: porin family protein [Bacteroidia bacterium]|nr:porin family protein [Bacteroidia bacterium]
MRKLFVTTFVFICLSAILFAQTQSEQNGAKFTLGIFGGLNIPQLSGGNNNEMSRDYTSRLGEAFGLTASCYLGSGLVLRADALYSSEGGKRNGLQAIDASSFNPQAPAGTYLYADFNNESILNYAEIPVMLKYSISTGEKSKFYIDFGPYFGFLLNAKQKTSGSSIIYADRAETMPVVETAQSFDASSDVTSSIKPFNFGLTGGIGFMQEAGPGNIFLDVRGAYGLTTDQKDKQEGESHNGYLLIAIGYSISL